MSRSPAFVEDQIAYVEHRIGLCSNSSPRDGTEYGIFATRFLVLARTIRWATVGVEIRNAAQSPRW